VDSETEGEVCEAPPVSTELLDMLDVQVRQAQAELAGALADRAWHEIRVRWPHATRLDVQVAWYVMLDGPRAQVYPYQLHQAGRLRPPIGEDDPEFSMLGGTLAGWLGRYAEAAHLPTGVSFLWAPDVGRASLDGHPANRAGH